MFAAQVALALTAVVGLWLEDLSAPWGIQKPGGHFVVGFQASDASGRPFIARR